MKAAALGGFLCLLVIVSYIWGHQDGFRAAVVSCPEPSKVVSIHSNPAYVDCYYLQESTYGRALRKSRVNRG
jgi:hypothetical protein